MLDVLIKGGTVVDGTGMAGYRADVAVADGRIVKIGSVNDSARRTIDATDKVVSPGFIDHHTHFDAQLLWDSLGSSSCWHGVTTVVTGNCSMSLAPCKPEGRESIVSSFARVEAISRKSLEAGIDWKWETFGQYLDRLEGQRGMNVACLVGHSALRSYVMGEAATERAANAAEIAQMREVLRQSLADGALGLSLNQSKHHFREDGKPLPGTVAERDELLALAEELGASGRGYLQVNGGTMGTEVTPEDNYAVLRALSDASGRRPVLFNQISHKWQAPEAWKEALAHGTRAVADGYRIHGACSTLPTTFEFTLLNVQLLFDAMPTWKPLMFAAPKERLAGLANPALRAKLCHEAREDQSKSNFHRRWDVVKVERVVKPENKWMEGRDLDSLGKEKGKHPVDVFLDLAVSENLETAFKTIVGNGDRDAVGEMQRHPATISGTSDAGAHTSFLADYGYCTELVGPWVRERRAMSLEQAVQRLTLMPASLLGLHGRGQLTQGYAADIVVFDPKTVAPQQSHVAYDYPADQPRQVQPATGIQCTIVNGEVFVEANQHTGALAGQVLRGGVGRAK